MSSNIVFIGKVNSGKSSLFNCLTGVNYNLVGSKPGLTIDVVMQNVFGNCLFDTPGINNINELDDVTTKIGNIDIICLVIPCNDVIDRLYRDIVKRLSALKMCIVRSKYDLVDNDIVCNAFSNIDSCNVSIFNKRSIDKLRRYLFSESEYHNCRNVEFTIFGRSNVGKSTIANAILNEDRFVVRDEIGTTKEVNKSNMDYPSTSLAITIVDTPGYRKNKQISDYELQSQDKTNTQLDQQWSANNMCFVVLNAFDGLTYADKKIIDHALNGFVVVILINKIDLVSFSILKDMKRIIKSQYPFVDLFSVSAFNSNDVKTIKKNIFSMANIGQVTFKTSEINKWIGSTGKNYIKYGVWIGGVSIKIFTRKHLLKSEISFLHKSFCNWFKYKGIKPKFTFHS